jgi:hypothetical protein
MLGGVSGLRFIPKRFGRIPRDVAVARLRRAEKSSNDSKAMMGNGAGPCVFRLSMPTRALRGQGSTGQAFGALLEKNGRL